MLRVKVNAVTDMGETGPSLPYEKLFAFPPKEPVNVKDDSSVTDAERIGLKWDTPLDNQGAVVLDYRVYCKKGTS